MVWKCKNDYHYTRLEMEHDYKISVPQEEFENQFWKHWIICLVRYFSYSQSSLTITGSDAMKWCCLLDMMVYMCT